MIGRDGAQESGGTHIELENRYSEVVGANVNEWKHDATVMGMEKEEKKDFSVPSKEEEQWLERMIQKHI